MRKFKLLKELPGVRAGAIFEQSAVTEGYDCIEGTMQSGLFLPEVIVETNTDWFEEVQEKEEKLYTKSDLLMLLKCRKHGLGAVFGGTITEEEFVKEFVKAKNKGFV
jgi:AMMECR1 domain-containing protein